ncbi:MAG: PQQ-binding-like beta-propeller repeat protein [Planctomycetaceae bacterium]
MQALTRIVTGFILAVAGSGLVGNPLRAEADSSAADASARAVARAIVDAAGISGGLCVHVGGDGRVTAELGRDRPFLVHGLVGDADQLPKAREAIRARGEYGRVSAEWIAAGKLPYADGLVNLLVVENFPAQSAAGLTMEEIVRVLTPRGVALLGAKAETMDALAKRVRAAAPSIVEVETVENAAGKWVKLVRPRPAGMDDWTHARHDPSRRATSRDELVAPTRSLRWIDGPGRARGHTGRPVGAVSAGGRFFSIIDEATPFMAVPPDAQLIARDAFNGTVLWKRPVRLGGRNDVSPNANTLVAVGDRVYAVLSPGGPLEALEAATGKTLDQYLDTQPDGMIVVNEGVLLLERNKLRLLDPQSGKTKWSAEPGSRENAFAAGGGRVVVNVPRNNEVVCFRIADGETQWRIDVSDLTRERFDRDLALCGIHGDVLAMATRSRLLGFSMKDGSRSWTHAYTASGRGHPINTFFSNGLVWAHDVGDKDAGRPDQWIGVDPRTGALGQSFPASFQDKCAPGQATEKYLITGRIHFFECTTGEVDFPHVARGACGFGAVPANGLVYTFPTDCRCYPMLYGVTAMSPDPLPHDGGGKGELERGPAYDRIERNAAAIDSEDWPCYRHDSRRSGAASTSVSPNAQSSWTADVAPGERITPPVVAGGRVFVAAVDAQQVCAFDAATGRESWRFTAGGRIPFPPTIHEGRCLFGSEDGFVYCLDAASGELAWRFRAAPGTRRIVAHGRLSSPWPVIGSVTIVNGTACALAGRHGPLDGGMRIVALDPLSGALAWETFPKEATRADLLVQGTKHLFLWEGCLEPESGLFRGRGHRIDEAPLRAQASFLTDVWSNRTAWEKGRATGQLLAFRTSARESNEDAGGDDSRPAATDDVFGLSAFPNADKYTATRPAEGDHRLFARRGDQAEDAWSLTVPVRVRALVPAGETLFAAGSPDVLEPTGGVLLALDAASGEQRAKLELAAPPVLDGLAAARGKLYVSMIDGRLTCLAGR